FPHHIGPELSVGSIQAVLPEVSFFRTGFASYDSKNSRVSGSGIQSNTHRRTLFFIDKNRNAPIVHRCEVGQPKHTDAVGFPLRQYRDIDGGIAIGQSVSNVNVIRALEAGNVVHDLTV